ncbi:MAG: GntR family transcriptional regulator [Bellilinea sp.]|nr:MAG: GntR family transcriptional regulator [Bellilinea sp.]
MQNHSFQLSELMHYLSCGKVKVGERIPSLSQLSQELGISIATLREQLEVARVMGLVEVRPRTGIRLLPFQFKPAVLQSLYFSLSQNSDTFLEFADLRTHVETSYWYEAVGLLNSEDHQQLKSLIQRAKEKLTASPPQIPHQEHRLLHLTIFKRLENPFVQGILEAYWEVYEAVGLDVYTDFAYLERVWQYHEKMVESICKQNFDEGYIALVEHMDLIYQRSKKPSFQTFE